MEKEVDKDFISYLDDDGKKKDQFIIIILETQIGVEFKFHSDEYNTIFIPWTRVLKIKRRGKNDRN